MRIILATALSVLAALPGMALAQTEFTFQGQLKHDGVPVTGQADLVFHLYDAETAGSEVVPQVGRSFVDVVDGLFAVQLDFGAGAFDGSARWLEIEVEFPSGVGTWTTLSPRQPVTAAPYALYALSGPGSGGSNWTLNGDDIYNANSGDVGIGTTSPDYPLHVEGSASRMVHIRNDAASGNALHASSNGTAVRAYGGGRGLDAYTASPSGRAVEAFNEAESGDAYAVYGETISPTGVALYGITSNGADYAGGVGVYGFADNDGMYTTGIGVYGLSTSDKPGIGVLGEATSTGTTYGVHGVSAHGTGVRGEQGASGNYGMLGTSSAGVYGRAAQAGDYAVRGSSVADGFAAYFSGGRNYFESDVGIGTADPGERLHVTGGDLRVDGNLSLYQGDVLALETTSGSRGKFLNFKNIDETGTAIQVGVSSSDGAGFINLRNRTGTTTTIELDGDTDSVADADTSGSILIRSTGGGPGGELVIGNDDGFHTIQALGGSAGTGGTLELFNESQAGTVFLDGDSSNDGLIRLRDADGNTGVLLRADSAGSVAGEISMYNDAGYETVELIAAEGDSTNGAQLRMRKANNTSTVLLDAEHGTDGGAYLQLDGGATDPTAYFIGSGSSRVDATLRVHNDQPNEGMAGYLTNNSNFATVHMKNDGTGETLWLENNGGGHLIVARSTARWEFWVDGDGYTNSRVLRIHGGADLSEGFDVRPTPTEAEDDPSRADGEPASGMVVSIDPSSPGRLVVSHEPYDRKVAGIISGAGGVNPGMLMGQAGSDADGDYPVALTGRVYCLCDASSGAIEPGDMLTTSETPGHAMKVTDHTRATGAIIGKAMTHLVKGETGLVLVLVSLQ
jgi:hypothetical protein